MHLSPVFFLAVVAAISTASPVIQKPCGKPADIVFVVDNSNSIWVVNYNKYVVPFITKIVQLFDVGPDPDQTRVGVISYGDYVKAHFGLNAHLSPQGLMEAVAGIKHQFMGKTYTDKALNYAVDMFTPEAGSRADVAHIIVLITDGESSDKYRTRIATQYAKTSGIGIFAIGVGKKTDENELRFIASRPSDKYKFSVGDYGALDSIKEDLALRTCEVTVPTTPAPPTTTPTTTPEPISDCGLEPADIFFVLDSSTSIRREDFEVRMLSFIKDVVSELNIHPSRVRVGVMTFSTKPHLVIGLEDYSSKRDLLEAVNPDIVKYTMGGTNTASALKEVRLNGFGASPSPAHVTKIAVVITDGRSWNRHLTKREAHLLRQSGVSVYAVGVGKGVHRGELEEMASTPKEEFVFSVPDFKALSQIKDKLIDRTCPMPLLPKDAFVCGNSPIDITVAFDRTTRTISQTRGIFEQVRVMNHRLYSLGGHIRTAVTSGDCPPTLEVPLAPPTEANAMISEMEHAIRPRLHSILKDWRVGQKNPSSDDWLSSLNDKVLVLLINQENAGELEDLVEQVNLLQDQGINVFVVLEEGVAKKEVSTWFKILGDRQVLDGVKKGEDFSGQILEFVCAV